MHDLELDVRAFGPEGDPRGAQSYRVRAPLDSATASATITELVARTDLKPGAYEMRLALHDVQGNRSGSVYADLEVPDFAKAALSLSGVLLTSSAAPRSAPKDALAPLVPLQPTASRIFTMNERVTAFARIYQGAKERLAPVTLAVRIVDAREQVVFSESETFAVDRFNQDRAADLRVDLPLARLLPGHHLLTIEVRTGEKITSRRQVQFEIK